MQNSPVRAVAEPRPASREAADLAAATQLAALPAPARLRAIQDYLAATGRTVLSDVLGPGNEVIPGAHYPESEVWDRATGAQWFFHGHEAAGNAGHGSASQFNEIGHFHIFLACDALPRGLTPFVLPEIAMAPVVLPVKESGDPGTHLSRRDRGRYTHLLGLSVDAQARPIALFTTNRWVTGEVWYRGEDVAKLLDRFTFTPPAAAPEAGNPAEAEPAGLTSLWLSALLQLLRGQITELLQSRDAAVMDWRRRRSRQHHVFEDHRLDRTSFAVIDLAALPDTARRG